MTGRPVCIVFTDVDETLVTVKTMMSFLEYHLDRTGAGAVEYHRVADSLRRMSARGVPRAELNRRYYRAFAGEPVELVHAHGRDWYAREVAAGGFFHEPVLAACQAHRASGAEIALVSGSFEPCLTPIAERVGASWTLCGGPVVSGGYYTGQLRPTMIGGGKAVAVRNLLAATGTDAAHCLAYADHASDLPMMLSTGAAVVVGDDPVLVEEGLRRAWPRLPGVRMDRRERA